MLRYFSLALCFVLGSTAVRAENKEQGRLENCGVVMQDGYIFSGSIARNIAASPTGNKPR